MQNIEMSVTGDMLTLKIDLSKRLGPSGSGKTIIVATTAGNAKIPGHENLRIGVNCYEKPE